MTRSGPLRLPEPSSRNEKSRTSASVEKCSDASRVSIRASSHCGNSTKPPTRRALRWGMTAVAPPYVSLQSAFSTHPTRWMNSSPTRARPRFRPTLARWPSPQRQRRRRRCPRRSTRPLPGRCWRSRNERQQKPRAGGRAGRQRRSRPLFARSMTTLRRCRFFGRTTWRRAAFRRAAHDCPVGVGARHALAVGGGRHPGRGEHRRRQRFRGLDRRWNTRGQVSGDGQSAVVRSRGEHQSPQCGSSRPRTRRASTLMFTAERCRLPMAIPLREAW